MTRSKIYESEAWLKMNFLIKGLKPSAMAKIAKCSENTIRTNLKKHGLIQ